MKRLFTILFLSVVSIVAAQNAPLMPGNTTLETKYIKEDTYQMKWYVLQNNEKHEVARINTQIRKGTTRFSIISKVDVNNAKTTWLDSTVTTLKDISPVRHYSNNIERAVQLKFGKSAVTGKFTDKAKKLEADINDAVKTTYFDSNFLPYLIRLLPLAEGYTQDIVTYDFSLGKHGLIMAQVKGVKSGVYKNKNGNQDVWIVTSMESIKGQPAQVDYYIDKADRRIWKQEIFDGMQHTLIERSE
jgi:hypothetical protein